MSLSNNSFMDSRDFYSLEKARNDHEEELHYCPDCGVYMTDANSRVVMIATSPDDGDKVMYCNNCADHLEALGDMNGEA